MDTGEFTVDSPARFYKDILKETKIPLQKSEKFFRIGEQAAVVIAMALTVLESASVENFDRTAVAGYGMEGSHHGNLKYWEDFVVNGRTEAQGHLFVGTLASTPLCQLALTLGCHGPVFYVSPAGEGPVLEDELMFLQDQCETLFLIETRPDYCRCMLLKVSGEGKIAEETLRIFEEIK